MKRFKLKSGKSILLDKLDYEYLRKYSWFEYKAKNSSYAHTRIPDKSRKSGYRIMSMHRMILEVSDPKVFVDHKNGNGLDNRRENIRTCTRSQNGCNRSHNSDNKTGYKGVYHTWDGYIMSKIVLNKKYIYLGYFKTEEEAALGYNAAAIKYHGEFAKLNIIKSKI